MADPLADVAERDPALAREPAELGLEGRGLRVVRGNDVVEDEAEPVGPRERPSDRAKGVEGEQARAVHGVGRVDDPVDTGPRGSPEDSLGEGRHHPSSRTRRIRFINTSGVTLHFCSPRSLTSSSTREICRPSRLAPERADHVLERLPPRVLAEHEPPLGPDLGRVDVLVGIGVLEHGRDVDPGLVCESMLADDRVGLADRDPGALGDERGEGRQVLEAVPVHAPLVIEPEKHLLEPGVPGPLAYPVHGGVELEGAGLGRRERVRGRAPEIVVAVGAERNPARRDETRLMTRVHLERQEAADRVRERDEGGPVLAAAAIHLGQERGLGPRGVLGREPDRETVVARVVDHPERVVEHLVPRSPVLEPDVELGSRDEDRDHVHLRGDRGVDVLLLRAGKAADPGVEVEGGHGPDALQLVGRDGGKARLDHLDPDPVEEGRDRGLLLARERDAGGLFAVPERHVADLNIPWFHNGLLRGSRPAR